MLTANDIGITRIKFKFMMFWVILGQNIMNLSAMLAIQNQSPAVWYDQNRIWFARRSFVEPGDLDSVTVMQYANYFRTVCWKQNRNKYANIPMKIIWYCTAVFAVSYWPLFRWSLGNLFFARDLSPEALHLLVNQSPVTCSACLVHPCLEPSCETNVEMLVQKRRWWLRARLQYLQW